MVLKLYISGCWTVCWEKTDVIFTTSTTQSLTDQFRKRSADKQKLKGKLPKWISDFFRCGSNNYQLYTAFFLKHLCKYHLHWQFYSEHYMHCTAIHVFILKSLKWSETASVLNHNKAFNNRSICQGGHRGRSWSGLSGPLAEIWLSPEVPVSCKYFVFFF